MVDAAHLADNSDLPLLDFVQEIYWYKRHHAFTRDRDAQEHKFVRSKISRLKGLVSIGAPYQEFLSTEPSLLSFPNLRSATLDPSLSHVEDEIEGDVFAVAKELERIVIPQLLKFKLPTKTPLYALKSLTAVGVTSILVEELAKFLPNLSQLSISAANVDDLAHLRKLSGLTRLSLLWRDRQTRNPAVFDKSPRFASYLEDALDFRKTMALLLPPTLQLHNLFFIRSASSMIEENLLLRACSQKHLGMLDALLEAFPAWDVDSHSRCKSTAICLAAANDLPHFVAALLRRGANPLIVDTKTNLSALTSAIKNGRADLAGAILAYCLQKWPPCKEWIFRAPQNGASALYAALMNPNRSALDWVLTQFDSGLVTHLGINDINVSSRSSVPMLHLLARRVPERLLHFHKTYGLSLTTLDSQGRSFMHLVDPTVPDFKEIVASAHSAAPAARLMSDSGLFHAACERNIPKVLFFLACGCKFSSVIVSYFRAAGKSMCASWRAYLCLSVSHPSLLRQPTDKKLIGAIVKYYCAQAGGVPQDLADLMVRSLILRQPSDSGMRTTTSLTASWRPGGDIY